MVLRKSLRILGIILVSIFGLIGLLFACLNLPFTRGMVTKKTNQVLNQSNLPIHINSIDRILPNSIQIQGIVIAGLSGDTIIHVDELRTNCRVMALMRKKVILKDLDLGPTGIELLMNYHTGEYNIAEAFTSDRKPEVDKVEDDKVSWEIFIEKGNLTSTHFRMNDSVSEIHVLQDFSRIGIKRFSLSLATNEIAANTLELEGTAGFVELGPGQASDKDSTGSPWSFGLQNLSLKDINFTYSTVTEGLALEMILGEGTLRANEMDLINKVVDMKEISLSMANITLNSGDRANQPEVQPKIDSDKFPWNLKSKLIDLENVNLKVGRNDTSSFNVEGLDMKLKGFQFDEEHASAAISTMNFNLNNGFSVKEIQGELDSDYKSTRLKLSVETGNSRLKLKGDAEGNFLGIISNPGGLRNAKMAIDKTDLSVLDLSYFNSELQDQPYFKILAERPISIGGILHVVNSAYGFSGISISQERNFSMTLNGSATDLFHAARATGDLNVFVSDVSMAWLNDWLAGFGLDERFKETTKLSLSSHISGSLNSPDFSMELRSNLGNIDVAGTLDFDADSFSVHSSLERVLLGEILNNPELGTFTGSVEATGTGHSPETLQAQVSLQVDSLLFHDYNYTHVNLEGTLRPEEYAFIIKVDDSNVRTDLKAILNPGDSIFEVQAAGTLFVQLDKLHFYKDTLSIEANFEADLIKRRDGLESDIDLTGISLANMKNSADIQHISAVIRADSVSSGLRAEADFFHIDLLVSHPFSEFRTIGQDYGNYLATFKDPNHVNAASRVQEIPEINLSGEVTYHEVLGLFIQDTSLYFSDLDFSIINRPSDQKINYNLQGTGLEYKVIRIGKLITSISDSAGILNLELYADDNSINSSPANKVQLTSQFTGGQNITSLAVRNKQDLVGYGFEVSSRLDSNIIVCIVPSGELILNREFWKMDTPSLLSLDIETWKILPDLKMHTDSAFIHLFSESAEGIDSFKGELGNVAISSILQEGLISGMPSGSISGTIDYSLIGNTERQLNSNLHMKDVSWSGLSYKSIGVQGSFKIDSSKAYRIDLSALLDSSRIVIKGDKIYGGTGAVYAEFSRVPIHTFQPFVKDYLSSMGGTLSGNMNLSSRAQQESFSGNIYMNQASLRINTLNALYKIPEDSVRFTGQRAVFDNFRVMDSLDNALIVNGFIDFSNRKLPMLDMEISSSKLQVMNRSEDEDVPLYGNIFVDSRLTLKGPLVNPDIKGKILLSEGTDVYYRYMEDLSISETQKIVSFTSYSNAGDQEVKQPIKTSGGLANSSIETIVEIDPGTRINFNLAQRAYKINAMIVGGGSLNYNMLNNNQVALSGKYEISEGTADVKLIGWPNKSFRIAEGGFIRWDGLIDNPEVSFEAVNKVSSSYTNPVDGKQRYVDFNVILKLSNQLSDLDIQFKISTTDQYLMSIINTLSPEEQMRQAITILLFEYVDLPGISTSSNYVSQQVNQLLATQLNQLAKTTISGIDISFGIDSYVQANEAGGEETKTSLSYEVSKNFLNDRAQIELSGRMNDLTQQAGASDLTLNNLSFEYRLDSAATKYLKVYNEHSYEDVFTGEIVKTGIGFSYRKRYHYFKDIWRRTEKKKKKKNHDK
jgi:translocation and assembly module TamB